MSAINGARRSWSYTNANYMLGRNIPLMGGAYYNCDTSTIRVRFDYDSSAIQHPTRSYVLSSNNEHVNSFPLL